MGTLVKRVREGQQQRCGSWCKGSMCKGSTPSHEKGKCKDITQRNHYSVMILYFYQILSKRLIIFDFSIKLLSGEKSQII